MFYKRIITFCLVSNLVQTSFLNHINPHTYKKEELVDIHVGQLISPRSVYPYNFYKLKWCPSTAGHQYDPDSYGVALRDTELTESPYQIKIGTYKDPAIACTQTMSKNEILQFRNYIK